MNFFNTIQGPAKRYLLFNSTRSVEYREGIGSDECANYRNKIEAAFDEMVEREDMMSDPETQEFLNSKELGKSEHFPISLHFTNKTSDFLNSSDLAFDESSKFIFVCTENSTALSRVGRIWSLVEPEIMGSIKVFKNSQQVNAQPPYEKIMVKDFETRAQRCLLQF